MTFKPIPGGPQFEDERPGHPRYSDPLRTWYYFPDEVRAEEAALAAALAAESSKGE